jgi:hypothetical protein
MRTRRVFIKQSLCPFLFLLLVTSLWGAPSHTPAVLQADKNGFNLEYDGVRILSTTSSWPMNATSSMSDGERIEQRLRVAGLGKGPVMLKLSVAASEQAMVRTAHGPSHNLRNNAVYDRFGDWMLEFPSQRTRIIPAPPLMAARGLRSESRAILSKVR